MSNGFDLIHVIRADHLPKGIYHTLEAWADPRVLLTQMRFNTTISMDICIMKKLCWPDI